MNKRKVWLLMRSRVNNGEQAYYTDSVYGNWTTSLQKAKDFTTIEEAEAKLDEKLEGTYYYQLKECYRKITTIEKKQYEEESRNTVS
jgi:hypothetical protein